jgi:hypothetical protein
MSIPIFLAMDLIVDDHRGMTDHLEMTVHVTIVEDEMIEMIDDMIGTEIETEIGWTTMTAVAAREHAVGAGVQFENVRGIGIGFVSVSPWIGSAIESVIIVISIADEKISLLGRG